MKSRVLYALALTCAASCTAPVSAPREPSGMAAAHRVSLLVTAPNGQSADTIAVGETAQLVAVLGGNPNKPINWTSRNTAVATVTSGGLVTGRAAGQVYIVAQRQNARDSARVTVTATNPPPSPNDTTVWVESTQWPGKCLAVRGGSLVAGAELEFRACADAATQKFAVNGAGPVKIGSGLCVTDGSQVGTWGTVATIAACNGGAYQSWTRNAAQEIRGVNSSCLDNNGGVNADGNQILVWGCSGGANQHWRWPTTNPASPPPPPPTGVDVFPGQSIQSVVNANPAGTTFILRAGTHTQQSVIPKAGDSFIGEGMGVTILDGQNTTPRAFYAWTGSAWVNNVTLRKMTVTRYNPPVQDAPISASAGPGSTSTGWVIDSVESSYNSTGGVHMGSHVRLTNSKIHHNLQLGVGGSGDSLVVENNEISYNNYTHAYDPGWEAGGSKWSITRWFVARGNFVHHNAGPGLWTDTDNIFALYENNVCEDNEDAGIFHEISYDAVIRNNTTRRNGLVLGRWAYGAGITISMSPNVEVYGNTSEGDYHGISALQQGDAGRGSAPYGRYLVQNLWVHDNTVNVVPGDGSAMGLSDDTGDPAVFASRNNRFDRNHYTNGAASSAPFAWQGVKNWTQWRGVGMDLNGTFIP